MNRSALILLLVSAGISVLAACSGPVGTPTPDATQAALDDLAVQLSIPGHALAQFTEEDIEYAQEVFRVRTLTERSQFSWDCYSDTLVTGTRYYRDVIDMPFHSLELDIPIGWTSISSNDGDPLPVRFPGERGARVINLQMAQNCEPFQLIDHPRRGGTYISIISEAKREAVEWLTDQTGATWNSERESLNPEHTRVTLLEVGTIEYLSESFGYVCCNDTRPHHYAFIEVDEVMYGFHMFETEASLSREAFTHMLQSMKFTLKPG